LPDWISDLTRDSLNTVLSRQPSLRVYSRQKIDFLQDKQHLSEIEVAEKLGMSKMLSADVAVKCDLCRGHAGPACVEACPTGSVMRLDPPGS
jgi:Fe-S-cluster-containing hydrogenase component 2